jgi:hemerythrin superfamily protein
MPSKKDLDAVALLKADHRELEGLFAKFESAKGEARKKALVQQICTELSAHAMIEEEILYPACRGEIEDDVLDEAYVEHDGAKVLIAELLASDPGDEFYESKVKVLSENIKHHVKEEEQRSEGMFAQAREAGLDMEELGARMKTRKKALLSQFKAKGLPTPETRSFVGHTLKKGEPIDKGAAPL